MNIELISRIRQQVRDALRSRSLEKARETDEQTRLRVEADLFVEDCMFQGLDPNNPVDRAVIVKSWLASHQEEDEDRDPTPRGGLDF